MTRASDRTEAMAERYLAHDYEPCEPSNSGKSQWRCRLCGRVSWAPVKAIYNPCPVRLADLLDRIDAKPKPAEDAPEERPRLPEMRLVRDVLDTVIDDEWYYPAERLEAAARLLKPQKPAEDAPFADRITDEFLRLDQPEQVGVPSAIFDALLAHSIKMMPAKPAEDAPQEQEPDKWAALITEGEANGCYRCDTCRGFRAHGQPCLFCTSAKSARDAKEVQP